jgi:uncharacterized protein YoxC
MENWQVALIVILAIMVGVMIPAIIQFQMTMRSLHRFVRNNEDDVRVTMVELNRLATHINRIGSVVEANTKQIQSFFNSLEGVGHSIRRLRGAVRTASLLGAAVGPALAAAVKARQEGAHTNAQPMKPSEVEALKEMLAREQKLNGATHGEEKRNDR